MGKLFHLTTPEDQYFYKDEEFDKRNIYFEMYSDGGDPHQIIVKDGILTIEDSSYNTGSDKKRKKSRYESEKYITNITHPNWHLYVRIYPKKECYSGFMSMGMGDNRSQTRVVVKLRLLNSDGSIGASRDYDKEAWYLRQKLSTEIKGEKNIPTPMEKKEI